jgi:hypothetical protein
MALLPARPESATVAAIYSWWGGKPGRPSRRLGASQIGQECERRLWYGFRWATGGEKFDGRMQRLFNRGHREEAVFVAELRGIGCTVHDIDPSTGEQFTFKGVGGHLVAKIDGVALGVPEAPKTWHVVGFKTINAKGHALLVKNGLAEAKPEHVAQNQIEMHLAQLERTLYLSANKDTDELYAERLRRDPAVGEALEAKAARVIYAPEPGPGISTDAAHFKCKFCPAAQLCHGQAAPQMSCRTCVHATPEPDGDGRWSCAKWRDADGKPSTIPFEAQQEGCAHHLFVPALLRNWGAVVDASEQEGWIEYKSADGFVFRNGPWGERSFTSKELAAATPSLLRDPQFMELRTKFAGTITAERVDEAA